MPASTSGREMHPLVVALASRIRDWREDLPQLSPLAVSGDLEEIIGTLDGEDLFIRNEVHCCRGLRKLHLETARLGLGLQIFIASSFLIRALICRCLVRHRRQPSRHLGRHRRPLTRWGSTAGADRPCVGTHSDSRVRPGAGAAHLGNDLFSLCAFHPPHQRPGTGLVRGFGRCLSDRARGCGADDVPRSEGCASYSVEIPWAGFLLPTAETQRQNSSRSGKSLRDLLG